MPNPILAFSARQRREPERFEDLLKHLSFMQDVSLPQLIDDIYWGKKWLLASESISLGIILTHNGFHDYGIDFPFPTQAFYLRNADLEDRFLNYHQRKFHATTIPRGTLSDHGVAFMTLSMKFDDFRDFVSKGHHFESPLIFQPTRQRILRERPIIVLCLVFLPAAPSRSAVTRISELDRVFPVMALSRIDDLPASVLQGSIMSTLAEIDMSASELSAFPIIFLTDFPSLKRLVLSNNKISEIPRDWSQSSLQELILDNNLIESIPRELMKVKSLRRLNLSRNGIVTFNSDFDWSSLSLVYLDLSSNRITGMLGFPFFYKLDQVNLSDNKIEVVEPCRREISEVFLQGNPLQYPPRYLISNPVEAASFLVKENMRSEMDLERQNRLRSIRDLPGNDLCFDCERKQPFCIVTAIWVFVCADCYEAHRTLSWSCALTTGGHYWSWKDLVKLESIGNRKAKELFKKSFPEFAARLGENPHPYPAKAEFRSYFKEMNEEIRLGFTRRGQELQAKSWWILNPDATWIEKGSEATTYSSVLVKEGSQIHHLGAMEKFRFAAEHLGFPASQVHKIFAISNANLLSNFENYRALIHGMHCASPNLFKKDDWKDLPNPGRRQLQLDILSKDISKWDWNDETKLGVHLMIHGASEEGVWQICQQGFETVAAIDAGYYGRGVYFTSSLDYADHHAKRSGNIGKPFLLSAVIPGNAFPVIEDPYLPAKTTDPEEELERNPKGYLGQACRLGYQSHHILVNVESPNMGLPTEDLAKTKFVDELVTFEAAQALPLFVFYLK